MRAVALVACISVGCFRGPAPAPTTRPAALKTPARDFASADTLAFLPEESRLVVSLDLKELLGSTSVKTFVPLLRKRVPEAVMQYFDRCKFDPLSLERVSFGIHNIDAAKPNAVIVIRGYHRDVLMKCIELARADKPGVIAIDNGIVTAPAGESRLAFTFADDTTLVIQVGPETTAATLRATIEAGAPLRSNVRFTELLKVDPSEPLWFVLDDAKRLASGMTGSPILAMIGSARISDSLTAQIRVRFGDASAASSTATMIQSQVASVTMFFDELEVTAEDSDVVMRAVMSDEKFASMLQLISGLVGP